MIRKSLWLVVCGVGIGLGGCWDVPIIVHRPVVFTNDVTAEDVEVDHIDADSAEIGGVVIDEDGNVLVRGDLVVEGTATAEEVIDLPDPPPPPPPPPPPDELIVTLRPPFVGLSAEGNPPASCTTFTIGTFNIEVPINIKGGVAPYTVRFRNYYGANEQADTEGDTSFFFDASVPTTHCVSSQVRVTNADGKKKDIFFYIRVR